MRYNVPVSNLDQHVTVSEDPTLVESLLLILSSSQAPPVLQLYIIVDIVLFL